MRMSARGLIAVLFCFAPCGRALCGPAVPPDKEIEPGTTIFEKEYSLRSPDEEQAGSWRLKAVQKAGGEIEISDELFIEEHPTRGKMGYKSTVVYRSAPSLSPVRATAETQSGGKTCMKGEVAFAEKTLSFSCVGLHDGHTGKPIDPPLKFEKKDIERPKCVLLFQSAFPVLGPRLLPKEGELKEVVFVEFPDDINAPELINMKENYRLVREPADEKGSYRMKVFGPLPDRPICTAQYDKNNKIIALHMGDTELVEVQEKKPE